MTTVALRELMAADRGSVDPRKFADDEFELYSIPAFDSGAPDLVYGRDIGSAKQVVKPGDVLLSKIVPHIRRAWVVPPSAGQRAIGSSEWIVFRGTSFYPSYLRHVLTSDHFHSEFMRTVAGVGGSLLRARPSYVAEISVPLPPIEDQRRLAAVLDQTDEVRAKRRASLALLDSLAESIFLDMFGDPVEDASRWPCRRIGEFVDRFEAGKSVDTSEADADLATHWVVKVSAITSGAFDPGESKPVPPDYEPPNEHLIRRGDLLFSRANTEALVGASAMVTEDPDRRILSDKIWRFVWREPSSVRPVFVWRMLQMPSIRRRIGWLATGTSGSMKNISQAKLMTLTVPAPPPELQRRFEERLAEVEVAHRSATCAATGLDELFLSLQQRAFSGML